MKYSYIVEMHRTFFLRCLSYERMFLQSFLTNLGVSRAFRRVISIKVVSMIYKLFFEYNERHYVFTSVFESSIFILMLLN